MWTAWRRRLRTVNDILSASGIPYRKTRFLKPPAGTYAVYTDHITTDGPDGIPALLYHSITIELYTASPDPEAEQAVENALVSHGMQFQKQDAYWLQKEQRYQIAYDFEYIEKRRI